MTTTQMTVAGAILVGFMGGFLFNRSDDDKSAATSSEQTASGEESMSEDTETTRGTGERSTRGGGSRSSQSGDASREPRLVGDWRNTEMFVSDGISIVIDHFMTINADGTMEAHDGGAAGSFGDEPWEPERSDETVRCEWRTKGNVLEIRGEGRDWTPLAEYEVSAESLLTVANGERQLWERI